MAYVALYRKYRSQSFGELMGQEAVTRTLQNAIRSGSIAHAYLFHGARGCGKTSTARLLARALNCIAQDAPTPEPCGECRLCAAIRDGNCMDVIEIDAASETSIDDVREKIIENVQYAPAEARYKIYIIDEVHDLSSKAFDALLKTLEEPPPHVIFVLATTELHKVPITIQSRCQRHRFQRGSLSDLATAVQRVVDAEGYTAEPEAVLSIARSAEGSWRDALSLLEQVLAYSDRHITAETVHRSIGTVGGEMLARVTETLALGRLDAVLAVAGELLESGTDVRQLLTALSGHLRDLLLIAAGAKQAACQEYGEERVAALMPQAALFDPPTLLAMMGVISAAERELRFSNQHRILLETTLLRMLPCHQPVQSREAQLGRAEAPTRTAAPPPLAATPTIVPRPPVSHSAPTVPAELDEEAEETPEEASAQEFEKPVTTAARVPASATQTQAPGETEAPERTPANDSRFADAITLEVVRRSWPRILKSLEKTAPTGIPFLKQAEVAGLEGKTVVLAFHDTFARDRIQNKPKGRELIERVINECLQTEGYKLRCIVADQDDSGGGSAAALKPSPAPAAPTSQEMPTLLDAPPPPAAPTRIADFDMPPPPAATNKSNGTPARPPAAPAEDAPTQSLPAANAAETGLLAETLELFGGEVIRSEKMT